MKQQQELLNINHRLFEKYCQSQNYYYTRDVNDILSDATTKGVVRFKDWMCIDEEDEFLKRIYLLTEYPSKIALLTEYYKFHNDIARIFQEPVATMLNKYYDKKRKYEYYRIAKLIDEENKKNPHKPPKGIVGDKPSPVNSQDSAPNEEEVQVEQNPKNLQILQELSWLNKRNAPSQQPPKDVSQTLNEICKQIGNCEEQSSLYIPLAMKTEEIKLDNFLSYMNRKASIQNNKQSTKLSQPQEQLIQSLIQSQQSRNTPKDVLQLRKAENYQPYNTKEKHFNFVKNQIDYLSKKQNTKTSTDAFESVTKLDSKLSESVKNKSKNNTQQSSKFIQNNIIIKDTKTLSPTPQLYKGSIGSFTHIKTQQSTTNQAKNLNINYLAKLLIEDEMTEQELKWKNGALTHRPISGTQNFFNSNRNSPAIRQQKSKLAPAEAFTYHKSKTSHHQPLVNPGLMPKNLISKGTTRKTTSQNIHIRQTSNQERMATEQVDQFKSKNRLHFQEFPLQQGHKKHFSDGRALWQKESLHENICYTERGPSAEVFFKNNLQQQNSPKGQNLKKSQNGNFAKQVSNGLIQQMIIKVAKQNQQFQVVNSKHKNS